MRSLETLRLVIFIGLTVTPLALMQTALIAPAAAQEMTACDWEAAHPSDPEHVGPGVGSSDVDTGKAMAACRWAVERYPQEPRFHYQLGRAMVYAADRAGEDWHPGMPHVRRAAEMQHTQAMFVLGLLEQRDERWCEAEPWLRAAADKGLKSARFSYVNEALSGRLDDCEYRAGTEQLAAYLDAAAAQVGSWYQGMLLESLRRSLGELP